MPQITLTSVYAKNSGLVISPQELRRNWLYGITANSPFVNQFNLEFSDDDIAFHIRASQKEVENYFAVKLFRQIYTESLMFDNDQWRTWGYVKCNYMLVYALELTGWLNSIKQTVYPAEWLTIKQISKDPELYHKNLWVVPAGNTGAVTNAVIYAGLLPNLGYLNAGKIPNYWHPVYVTGFEKVPEDVMQVIGSIAAIQLLLISGANVLGFPGLTSQSLSIDGLSQSISSPSNAYGARIKDMVTALEKKMANMRDTYRGLNWTVA